MQKKVRNLIIKNTGRAPAADNITEISGNLHGTYYYSVRAKKILIVNNRCGNY